MAGRRQKSEPYKAFEKNADRAAAFVRIFTLDRGRGQPSDEDTQLLRGALVFAVGALDAYLHELVLEIVTTFVPDSADLAAALKELKLEKVLLAMARAEDHASARAAFADAVDGHLDDKSFMGPDGVLRALRFVGCASTLETIANGIGRPDLGAALGRYTDMRHQIVHRGRKTRLSREDASDCIGLISAIAGHVDRRVIEKHYR